MSPHLQDQTISKVHMSDFAELIVRDYLRSNGRVETLATLSKECAAAGVSEPQAESWYKISHCIMLPDMLLRNSSVEGSQYPSVLEVLVSELANGDRGKRREGTMIIQQQMTTSPVNTAADLVDLAGRTGEKGRHKLPLASSPSQSRSAPGTPATKLVPGLAVGLASKENGNVTVEEPMPSTLNVTATLISPRGGRVGGEKEKVAVKGAAPAAGLKRTLVLNDRGKDKKLLQQPPKFHFKQEGVRKPQLSQESWIPEELRKRMVRRNLHCFKGNLMETVAWEKFSNKQAFRNRRTPLDIAKEQERFGTDCPKPCALCEQNFSSVNLVLAVPYKAIVDLRMHWHQRSGSKKPPEINFKMKRPPQCYNEVRVCAFCSQQFSDPARYRPTDEMKSAAAKKALEDEIRRKEKSYWDPLAAGSDGTKVLPLGADEMLKSQKSLARSKTH